ncbi:MAG: hypothetical protein Tsb0013_06270 [Phycisphaerales bacterium]
MGLRYLLLLPFAFAMGCSDHQPASDSKAEAAHSQPTIVVTDHQLECIVARMVPAGTRIEIVAPDDPEAHEHAWSPTRERARTLRNASLVITAGGGTDAWIDLLGLRDDRVLRLADAFDDRLIVVDTDTHSHGLAGEHSHPIHAPRPWLDPTFAAVCVERIGRRLTADGLVLAETFDDTTIRAPLASIADALQRDATGVLIVTTSDAWRYPARAIGADVVVVEPSTDPVWIRVEVSASNARRVVVIGDLDIGAIRPTLEESGVQVASIAQGQDACSWLDALDAFAQAVTAP